MKQILNRLINHETLTVAEAKTVLVNISTGQYNPSQIASFLTVYMMRNITIEELFGFREALLELCIAIDFSAYNTIDLCGTGGDGKNTINISTLASFIVAGAGQKVVKHGNRAASSKSGAADLLEALGININLDGVGVEQTFAQLGIGFCFAPVFHPAMRFAASARKELATATVFNILGPLANPAQPQAAAIGVANERMHLVMAQVLSDRGVDGFVFRGDDGLDEITLATTTSVMTIGGGTITNDLIDPLDFDIQRAPISDLVGGDAAENARITTAIFAGESGAPRDAVLLNAAAAIAAYDARFDLNLHQRMELGVSRAIEAIDSGASTRLVKQWAELTQKLGA